MHTEYYGEVNIAMQVNIPRLGAWQNILTCFLGNPEIQPTTASLSMNTTAEKVLTFKLL